MRFALQTMHVGQYHEYKNTFFFLISISIYPIDNLKNV